MPLDSAYLQGRPWCYFRTKSGVATALEDMRASAEKHGWETYDLTDTGQQGEFQSTAFAAWHADGTGGRAVWVIPDVKGHKIKGQGEEAEQGEESVQGGEAVQEQEAVQGEEFMQGKEDVQGEEDFWL